MLHSPNCVRTEFDCKVDSKTKAKTLILALQHCTDFTLDGETRAITLILVLQPCADSSFDCETKAETSILAQQPCPDSTFDCKTKAKTLIQGSRCWRSRSRSWRLRVLQVEHASFVQLHVPPPKGCAPERFISPAGAVLAYSDFPLRDAHVSVSFLRRRSPCSLARVWLAQTSPRRDAHLSVSFLWRRSPYSLPPVWLAQTSP